MLPFVDRTGPANPRIHTFRQSSALWLDLCQLKLHKPHILITHLIKQVFPEWPRLVRIDLRHLCANCFRKPVRRCSRPHNHQQTRHADVTVGEVERRQPFLLRVNVPNIAHNPDDCSKRIIRIATKTFANRILIGPVATSKTLADYQFERPVTPIRR